MNNNKEQVCIRISRNSKAYLFFLKFMILLQNLHCDHDNDHKNKNPKMHFAAITLFCHQGNLISSSSNVL